METYNSNPFSQIPAAFIVIYIIVALLCIVAMWKVFTKAGKPGWASIIPIYNAIVLLEIVGKPVWWLLLFLIPCVNFVFLIWTYNLLSKSFGKSEGFTVGIVILPFIFIPILGFGDAVYQGPAAAEAGGLKPRDPFGPTNYQDPNPPQA